MSDKEQDCRVKAIGQGIGRRKGKIDMIRKKKKFSYTVTICRPNEMILLPHMLKGAKVVITMTKDKKEVLIAGNKQGLLYVAKHLIITALYPYDYSTELKYCLSEVDKGSKDLFIKNLGFLSKKEQESYVKFYEKQMIPGDNEIWRPGWKKPRKLT